MQETTLTIYRRVSRGRNTFGFNIVGIVDENTGARIRAIGGGYDMLGAVVGEWLNKNYKNRIQTVDSNEFPAVNNGVVGGACGRSTVYRIANAIGLKITENWNKKGNIVSITVTDTL